MSDNAFFSDLILRNAVSTPAQEATVRYYGICPKCLSPVRLLSEMAGYDWFQCRADYCLTIWVVNTSSIPPCPIPKHEKPASSTPSYVAQMASQAHRIPQGSDGRSLWLSAHDALLARRHDYGAPRRALPLRDQLHPWK